MRRYLFAFLVSVFASDLALAAKLKLALNWKAEPQFGGFYAAKLLGFFEQEGLEVEILEGGSGTPTVQMLAAGTVDYAILSADEIVLSHDRGAKDVVALFSTYQTNPQAIMFHDSKPYKNLQELFSDSKQTLLWQSGLPYARYLTKKLGPIKAKIAPYSGGIANFLNDENIAQQCFYTSEPLLAAKAGKKVKTILIADEGFNPYTTVLATRNTRLKKSKVEVDKFVQAVRIGWESYLKQPGPINQEMAKINKAMDLKSFGASAMAQEGLIKTDKLGQMNPARWQQLVEQMHELQLIQGRPKSSELFYQ